MSTPVRHTAGRGSPADGPKNQREYSQLQQKAHTTPNMHDERSVPDEDPEIGKLDPTVTRRADCRGVNTANTDSTSIDQPGKRDADSAGVYLSATATEKINNAKRRCSKKMENDSRYVPPDPDLTARKRPEKYKQHSSKIENDSRYIPPDPIPSGCSYTGGTRMRFTAEEDKAIQDGLEKVAGPNWAEIKLSHAYVLRNRTHVNIKDRARTLGFCPEVGSRILFTAEEDNAIKDGLKKVGGPKWTEIKLSHAHVLRNRTHVNIKDRVRTMEQNNIT